MTEQEIMQRIDASEFQINQAYGSLRSAARDVGEKGLQAAKSARNSALLAASNSKTANTLLPLLISVVGFLLFRFAWFLALLMVVGGIVLAYNLNDKADRKKRNVESTYNSMVSTAEYQQQSLDAVLNSNTKI